MNPTCTACDDTGILVENDFDGQTNHPCPLCTYYGRRCRVLAQQFGTDAERRRIAEASRRRPMTPPRPPVHS